MRQERFGIATPGKETDWNRGAILDHYSQAVWRGSDSQNNGNVIGALFPTDDSAISSAQPRASAIIRT